MRNFDYLEPTTVAEACALLKLHGSEAKVFAGGAHLTILMKQGLYQPKALVNIKKISELKGISFDSTEGLIIGALVTHREIEILFEYLFLAGADLVEQSTELLD